MILGATPPEEGISLEDHVKFVEREHLTILEEWKQYFGSLPPPVPSMRAIVAADEENWDPDTGTTMNTENAVPGVTPQDLRQTLGIVENDHDNWDSDDDNVDHNGDPVEPHTQQRTQTVGLRPRGRIEPRQ